MRRGASLSETALAALFFLASTVIFTWPIAAHVGDGLADLGDAKLTSWILNWDFHQLFRHPTALFQANIFYPSPYALTFSENLLGVSAFGFPLYALGLSALAVYNTLFLVGIFLSAIAAWALARWITGDWIAALLAGIVYAYLPWRVAQIAHLHFQWGGFICLLLLFLLRYLQSGARSDAILFGLCWGWNALSNIHYALFSGVLVAVVLIWNLLTGGAERLRRVKTALAVCAIVGLLLIPIFVPYWRASQYYGVRRTIEEIAFYSGRPIDFLRTDAANRLYGRLSERWPHPETEFFAGFVPLGLALYALFRLRRGSAAAPINSRPEQSSWRATVVRACDLLLLAAVALCVLSKWRGGVTIWSVKVRDPGRVFVLGSFLLFLRLTLAFPRVARARNLAEFLRRSRLPSEAVLLIAILATGAVIALGAHTPYYRFLVQSAGFLFAAIRVPARGIVLFDLALGVLAAWGLSVATSRASPRWRTAGITAALLLTAVEYRAFPFRVDPVKPSAAPIYLWLASERIPGAVMEWPLGVQFDAEYVFRSTAHWKSLVNGVSGFYPPPWVALAEALGRDPIPAEAWGKVPAGTAVVILHGDDPERADSFARFRAAAADAVVAGRLEPIAEFPHERGFDYVFRVTSAPEFAASLTGDMRAHARRRFALLDSRGSTSR